MLIACVLLENKERILESLTLLVVVVIVVEREDSECSSAQC